MVNFSQKGLSLYLSLIIMTLLLAVALGISTILISQQKMIKGMGDSIIAYYAADTGIEIALMDAMETESPTDRSGTLANGATYEVKVIDGSDPSCPASYWCIKSTGSFNNRKRAIQVGL